MQDLGISLTIQPQLTSQSQFLQIVSVCLLGNREEIQLGLNTPIQNRLKTGLS